MTTQPSKDGGEAVNARDGSRGASAATESYQDGHPDPVAAQDVQSTGPNAEVMATTLSIRTAPTVEASPASTTSEHANTHDKASAEYTDYDEKHPPEDDIVAGEADGKEVDQESRSEIQSIMDQFADDGQSDELPPPEADLPSLFPPRASSLEADSISIATSASRRRNSRDSYNFNPSIARPPSISDGLPPLPPPDSEKPETRSPLSPTGLPVFQPPPPDDDAELPFDFHRFLEQLRHRTADPVARFLRSFLNEFSKKQWTVNEQVKIITDFLEFIAKKMSQCDVWRSVSDAEFDNAREGMEKLVMNRLYSQTFSPAIPPAENSGSAKSRRARAQATSPTGPGRRGQHLEDVERDDVIAQKIRIYGWIREEHLDIPSVGDKGRKFLSLAQQELLKINSYRAPRDKVIQILNCCKVIFGFLKNNKTDQSADSFVPLLIYTVLKANPAHLASNVQYILRFRNQDKLGGEAGYYISSLMGVISFVENLDRTNLTISNEEFETNVEAAVSAIAEGHRNSVELEAASNAASTSVAAGASVKSTPTSATTTSSGLSPSLLPSAGFLSGATGKSAPSRAQLTPRNSSDGGRDALLSSPKRNASQRLAVDTSSSSGPSIGSGGGSGSGGDSGDDIASGLLRSIQRPLTNIGRMFSDDKTPSTANSSSVRPPQHPQHREDSDVLRLFGGGGGGGGGSASTTGMHAPRTSSRHPPPSSAAVAPSPLPADAQTQQEHLVPSQFQQQQYQQPYQAGDFPGRQGHRERPARDASGRGQVEAARQQSAREAEAQRARSEEHRLVVETLQGMFPELDKDIISDVVRMKEGRVGMAVDACLALSN